MFYKNEEGYINLLKDTLNGEYKNTRNGNVFSQFGCMIKFDNISNNFLYNLVYKKKQKEKRIEPKLSINDGKLLNYSRSIFI